jgi:hypothetical protein
MDYFSRKSLSKYLMNNIEFNKHDVDIFINGMWQKYEDNIGRRTRSKTHVNRGRSSCVVKVDFDFSLVKSEVQVAL